MKFWIKPIISGILLIFSLITIVILVSLIYKVQSNNTNIGMWTVLVTVCIFVANKSFDQLFEGLREIKKRKYYLNALKMYMRDFLIELRDFSFGRYRRDDKITEVQGFIEKFKNFLYLLGKIDVTYFNKMEIEILLHLRMNIALTLPYLEQRKNYFLALNNDDDDNDNDVLVDIHEWDILDEILRYYEVSSTDSDDEINEAVKNFFEKFN